jgi:hypothetical protein
MPNRQSLQCRSASLGVADCAGVWETIALPVAFFLKLRPHGRAHFQPALPIGAPQYFLNELFGCCQAVLLQNSLHHFLFGNHPIAQIRRELGDSTWLLWPRIRVAAKGIILPCAGYELRKARECSVPRGGKNILHHCHASNFCK